MTFPAHTLDTAPSDSRAAMARTEEKFGAVPPVVARLAGSPRLLNGFLSASAAFDESSLEPAAREVVIMTVAVRNDCRVCVAIHRDALRAIGRRDLIDPLLTNQPLPDAGLEAVRMFAHRVLDAAGAVDDEGVQEFLRAGHTTEQALDVVFGIGVYTMSTFANRLVGG